MLPSFSDCAKQVVCGTHHTLILSISGLVYAFGRNTEGQLGIGHRHNADQCTVVTQISKIPMKCISAGSFSASISEDSGNLFIWGTGSFGQFVVPHRVKRIKSEVLQVSIGQGFGLALSIDG